MMTSKIRQKVPLGSRIEANIPRLSAEEIAKRQAQRKEFAQRCRELFERVYPDLVQNHYNWFIYIEPDSKDYIIDPDEEICFQKIRQKHPDAKIMAMRLNETGTCGRI